MLSKSYILLLSVFIFCSLGLKTKAYAKTCNLTISIDSNFSLKLFDDFELLSATGNFKADRDVDKITKMFILKWHNLPKDNYTLIIKTVFDTKKYEITLKNDTSITLTNFYELHNKFTLTKHDYLSSKIIKVCYKTNGCFHDDNHCLLKSKQTTNIFAPLLKIALLIKTLWERL